MESAGLRHRFQPTDSAARLARETLHSDSYLASGSAGITRVIDDDQARLPVAFVEVPRYEINLSLPPRQRYAAVAEDFRSKLEFIPDLFDELIQEMFPQKLLAKGIKSAARLFLRRVYDDEENEELRGISEATDVPMHFLVALNTLLDTFMGCTSGGARVVGPPSRRKRHAPKTSMMHFRTLDWGMDPLRRLVVQLDFVREPGGPPVARSLTYFGYVGLLTGVREGLSVSLNFRPHHDRSTLHKRLGFRWHQAMVVLGRRRSISSALRQCIVLDLDGAGSAEEGDVLFNSFTQQTLPHYLQSESTAAYIVFCTPNKVYIVEKDNRSGTVESSDTFLVALNHDQSDEEQPAQLEETVEQKKPQLDVTGMAELVNYSVERKRDAERMWAEDSERVRYDRKLDFAAVEEGDVISWLAPYRGISNDETHYAVVMDPLRGTIVWSGLYEEYPICYSDGDSMG